MSIWQLFPDSAHYHCLAFADRNIWSNIVQMFRGVSLLQSWKPLAVYIDERKLPGHFPSLAGGLPPIFNKHALEVLNPLIEGSVEALPLIFDEDELYAINVLDVADCLDVKKSEIEYFPDGGVMYVSRHVFNKECLGDERHIFKIPQEIVKRVFVSDAFKKLVEKEHLEGLNFRQIS